MNNMQYMYINNTAMPWIKKIEQKKKVTSIKELNQPRFFFVSCFCVPEVDGWERSPASPKNERKQFIKVWLIIPNIYNALFP